MFAGHSYFGRSRAFDLRSKHPDLSNLDAWALEMTPNRILRRFFLLGELSSLLTTWPYKRKDCLESICTALNMSTNGTVDTLRQRILSHVERKPENEDKIKEMAFSFNRTGKRKNSSKYPFSPVIRVSTSNHSTPIPNINSQSLFEDSHDDQSDNNEDADVTRAIDELNELYEQCMSMHDKDDQKSSQEEDPDLIEEISYDSPEHLNNADNDENKESESCDDDENDHSITHSMFTRRQSKIDHWVESITNSVALKDEHINKLAPLSR